MEITWFGNSCFRITERNYATVVTDPFDAAVAGYNPLKLKAEIVTISSNDLSHNNVSVVKGNPFVIEGPGEYERGVSFLRASRPPRFCLNIRNYAIRSMSSITAPSPSTPWADQRGSQSDDGGRVGNINIALVPVGSGGGLNASKAAEVISMLEPNIVIPMHYETPYSKLELDPLSKFLKEMGLTELRDNGKL
jgi:L-ascorbate metabolism protein UlaG (beta-lactamase superfamily)